MSHGDGVFIWNGMRELGREVGWEGLDKISGGSGLACAAEALGLSASRRSVAG